MHDINQNQVGYQHDIQIKPVISKDNNNSENLNNNEVFPEGWGLFPRALMELLKSMDVLYLKQNSKDMLLSITVIEL